MPRRLGKPSRDAKYREQAERVELVRKQAGFTALKDLHEVLADRGFKVSYEALRHWHRGDREPAPDYYAALHKHFGASLRFLLVGEGPLFDEDLDLEALGARFPAGVIDGLKDAPPAMAHLAFLHGAILLSLPDPLAYMETRESEDQEVDLMNLLVRWARAPLEAVGMMGMPTNQVTAYYNALFSAVQGIVPPQGEGRPVDEIIDRWISTMSQEDTDAQET